MLYLLHLQGRKQEIKGGNIKIRLPWWYNGELNYNYCRNSNRFFWIKSKKQKRCLWTSLAKSGVKTELLIQQRNCDTSMKIILYKCLNKCLFDPHELGKVENKTNEINSVLKHRFEKQAPSESCSCPVTWLGKYEPLPRDEITQITKIHPTHFMMGLVQVPKNHINIKEPCLKEKASVITMNHLYLYMETFASVKETSNLALCWMSWRSSVCLGFNYISEHWPGLINILLIA